MQQAALAYQQVARQTASPRELEATLLYRSAANLQRIRDDWANSAADLSDALNFNRKLWTVFLDEMVQPDCDLPQPIRQNIANLGLFVAKHSLAIQAKSDPRKLDVLININREIASGLRATAAK